MPIDSVGYWRYDLSAMEMNGKYLEMKEMFKWIQNITEMSSICHPQSLFIIHFECRS